MGLGAVAVLAALMVLQAAVPAAAVPQTADQTNSTTCSFHGVPVGIGCRCEDGWATPHDGAGCSYPLLDSATVTATWMIPGALRWHLGYESYWIGQVSLVAAALGIVAVWTIAVAMSSGDYYRPLSPSEVSGGPQVMQFSGLCLTAAVLWMIIDYYRVMTCNLGHENGLETAFCFAAYARH